MSTPPNVDPVDIAASYPDPPLGHGVEATVVHPGTPVDPGLVERLDGTPAGPAEVLLSAERLSVGTEWTVSGAVRFRRRIATYTRTVEVTVRREELQVEVRDVTDRAGAWVGTSLHGPAVAAPPVVTGPGTFVLREEVPDVVVSIRPYEQVVVDIVRVAEQVRVDGTVRREQASVSGDTGVAHPPR